jgi:cysteine synthase A
VQLRNIVPPQCANLFVKLLAHAVIARAEADGRLKPGEMVVEYTGGSTGTSLAADADSGLKYLSTDVFRSRQGT